MPCIHFASVSVTAKVAAIAAGVSVANGGLANLAAFTISLIFAPRTGLLRIPRHCHSHRAGSGHRRPDARPLPERRNERLAVATVSAAS